MVNKAFGLPCCCDCVACSDGTPDQLTVTFSGIVSGECDDCTDLNSPTTFALNYIGRAPASGNETHTPKIDPCWWEYR